MDYIGRPARPDRKTDCVFLARPLPLVQTRKNKLRFPSRRTSCCKKVRAARSSIFSIGVLPAVPLENESHSVSAVKFKRSASFLSSLPGMQPRRTLRKKKSVRELRAPTNVGSESRVKADWEMSKMLKSQSCVENYNTGWVSPHLFFVFFFFLFNKETLILLILNLKIIKLLYICYIFKLNLRKVYILLWSNLSSSDSPATFSTLCFRNYFFRMLTAEAFENSCSPFTRKWFLAHPIYIYIYICRLFLQTKERTKEPTKL